MSDWLFALVVLAFGVFLALHVDRQKRAPGPPAERKDRRKWLYFWFLGRFPTKEEQLEEEEAERDEAQREREKREEEKRK